MGVTVNPISGGGGLSAPVDAVNIADGSVSDTEFQYLNGVTSNIQTQIDGAGGLEAIQSVLQSNDTTTYANTELVLNLEANSTYWIDMDLILLYANQAYVYLNFSSAPTYYTMAYGSGYPYLVNASRRTAVGYELALSGQQTWAATGKWYGSVKTGAATTLTIQIKKLYSLVELHKGSSLRAIKRV